jgi:hypothetical protein
VGRVLWSSHSALTHKTRVEVCQSHTLRAENGLGRPTRASQSSSAASEIQAQYETSGTHPDEKKITASDSGLRSSRPLPCKMSSRVWRPAPWVTARTSTTWRFATSLRSPRWSQHTTCSMSDHTALQVTVSPCWRTSPTPFACNSARRGASTSVLSRSRSTTSGRVFARHCTSTSLGLSSCQCIGSLATWMWGSSQPSVETHGDRSDQVRCNERHDPSARISRTVPHLHDTLGAEWGA